MIEEHNMQHDDLNTKIIKALEDKAQNHSKKHVVIDQVFNKIEEQKHQRFNRWGLAGFALAAAITGISIFPSHVVKPTNEPVLSVSSAKLTPQLADDLEMLLVLGEDSYVR